MKIAYLMQAGAPDVRQQPLSGPANHVKHVFEELHRLGHQVRLLAYLDGRIWKSDDLETYDPVFIHRLDRGLLRLFERGVRRIQSELRLPYAALFESLRFAQACRQELSEFDLFFERMGWMGYGGGLASRWLGIPLVLEVNGDHLTEMEMLGVAPQGMQRKLSTKLTRTTVVQAACVVATGEGWRQRFIDRWRIEPAKVVVIENGSEVVSLLRREQLRSFSEDDPAGTMTVVYIGAFEPWHGVTVWLRAMALTRAEGVPIKSVLIGAGSELERIKQLIGELNLDRRVMLTGQLAAPQFAPYLAGADIGVSPYCGRVEYSGLKLLDYKGAGLATIASGENGQPAILEHGRTGWIVPPCDEEALGQALVQLAANTELRRRIGQEARLEAERCHSWRHTAQQLNNVFNQVVQK